ncbi:MAG: hypothetical protein AWM53_00395 [Candidatus Dichloromethanomonas elyunquensis]|nr:MAG: hypothetical protein AWM53_00395 [Candidatus Dichloromethanomonas elyunquensis]
MNEDKLKSLLRFKMLLIQKIADSLPEDVRKAVKEREIILFKVIYEFQINLRANEKSGSKYPGLIFYAYLVNFFGKTKTA